MIYSHADACPCAVKYSVRPPDTGLPQPPRYPCPRAVYRIFLPGDMVSGRRCRSPYPEGPFPRQRCWRRNRMWPLHGCVGNYASCAAGILAIVYFSHAFSPPPLPSDPVEAAAKSYYNSKVGIYAAVAFYLGAALSKLPGLASLPAAPLIQCRPVMLKTSSQSFIGSLLASLVRTTNMRADVHLVACTLQLRTAGTPASQPHAFERQEHCHLSAVLRDRPARADSSVLPQPKQSTMALPCRLFGAPGAGHQHDPPAPSGVALHPRRPDLLHDLPRVHAVPGRQRCPPVPAGEANT